MEDYINSTIEELVRNPNFIISVQLVDCISEKLAEAWEAGHREGYETSSGERHFE